MDALAGDWNDGGHILRNDNFPGERRIQHWLQSKSGGYPRTGEFEQEYSSSASATNLEIFLIHRPQQRFLSFNSKAEASLLGQVTPALPNSCTSDSRMPLQMQTNMVTFCLYD